MKKTILKIASITAAFFLGLMGMGYYLMAGNADSTAHMASATLPLIYLERGGRSFNLLHGYTESMDAAYIRDAVLPLSDDRTISIRIESPDTSVRNVYYEVRSTNMERLIEDGELTDLQRDGDEIRADFQLMDLLEEGEEYLLVLRLELEQGREVWYYTHLSNIPDTHLDECLDFVDTIHNALFDKNNTVSIAQYMETDSTADNDTLDHVTIHSRYNQMIWADMDVQPPSGEVRTYITEIEDSVASIRLEYEVDYVNENGETESYEVTEAYRVRYTDQRMYLLNYDRKTDRIFDPSLDIFSDTAINLGILNTEVEYRKNEEENITFKIELLESVSYFGKLSNEIEIVKEGSGFYAIVTKMKYYNDKYDTDMDTRTKLPFQISYAMSIHKAQGLEFDSVKIVITKESDEQVTKNIFYTAVTRAKKNLKVYWQPEVADYVLGNIENSEESKTADLSILSEQLKKYI